MVVPRHHHDPAGEPHGQQHDTMAAITKLFYSASPSFHHELVDHHRVRVLVDACRDGVRGDGLAADQQRPAGRACRGVVAVADRHHPEPAGRLLAVGQPAPQGGEHDHGVPGDLAGQPEGPGQPPGPDPHPGGGLIGHQLGQESGHGGRARPREQLVGGDRVVQDHPERHQQDPPGQPGASPTGERGLLRWPQPGHTPVSAGCRQALIGSSIHPTYPGGTRQTWPERAAPAAQLACPPATRPTGRLQRGRPPAWPQLAGPSARARLSGPAGSPFLAARAVLAAPAPGRASLPRCPAHRPAWPE